MTVLSQLVEKYKLPVIVSTHPRTKKRLEVPPDFKPDSMIHFLKPFGFIDYVHLQQHAKCAISYSGTISEESVILSFPAMSLRQSMERPEAQDAGTIILTGFEVDVVLKAIKTVISEHEGSRYKQIAQD